VKLVVYPLPKSIKSLEEKSKEDKGKGGARGI